MKNNQDNINGGPRNGGSSSLPPAPPPLPKTPQERVEQARELAFGIYARCGGLCKYVEEISDHYLKLIHAAEVMGPGHVTVEPDMLLMEILSRTMATRKNLEVAADRVWALIEPFQTDYDASSSGPVRIGALTETNAHMMAVRLAERIEAMMKKYGIEMLPVHGDEQNTKGRQLIEEWRTKARQMHMRLVEVLGADYDEQHANWVALVRLESVRVLERLRLARPGMVPEEEWIIAALEKAGKPMKQMELLAAAGLNPDNGSHKSLLANMRVRGWVNNNGNGYILPEWEK